MARFRYNLQGILDIKYKMETQAKQSFATASAQLSEQEEILAHMEARLGELEAEAARLRNGLLNFRDLQDNELSRNLQKGRIADQHVRIAACEKELEQRRIEMTEAMQERKMYESLREKAFKEFMVEENRAEGKVIDELTSYTYGQKK